MGVSSVKFSRKTDDSMAGCETAKIARQTRCPPARAKTTRRYCEDSWLCDLVRRSRNEVAAPNPKATYWNPAVGVTSGDETRCGGQEALFESNRRCLNRTILVSRRRLIRDIPAAKLPSSSQH